MSKPLLLYHWSPRIRRKQIIRYGLRPGSLSRCGEWKPPHICFGASPSFAWASVMVTAGKEKQEWDLWMLRTDRLNNIVQERMDWSDGREYRIYDRIYKKDIWYVGSRWRKKRGK